MPLKVVRLPIVRNTKYTRNGAKSYNWAMLKFAPKAKPTKGPFRWNNDKQKVMKVDASGSTSDIAASDVQQDSQYLVTCQIGGQSLKMDFDTGSSDLWVLSSLLPSQDQTTAKTNGHTIYTPGSSSKPMQGSTWQISYGDGSSASGVVCTDTVQIGPITINNQAVEEAQKADSSFLAANGSDGLLGLAFDTINTVKPNPVNTPVQNMIAQGDIKADSEVFTCYLASYKDKSESSFYTFGAIDQTFANGKTFEYIPVDSSQGFWQWTCPTMTINGTDQSLATSVSILDTGTTLCLLSDADCQKIYSGWGTNDQQAGGYVFPADTPLSKMPTLTFKWGNTTVTFQKEYFAYNTVQGSNNVFGSIQSSGGIGMNIFGDAFLHNTYVVWDVSKPQLGMIEIATNDQ